MSGGLQACRMRNLVRTKTFERDRTRQLAPKYIPAYIPLHVKLPTRVSVANPAPVSILQSGEIEGMPYTLYSDGSIEAELPQGRLRFKSLTDLRDHLG